MAPGLIFKNGREIDDRAAGVARIFPAAARALLIGGEESEIDVLELLGADALDEADFVAHGLELPERFVVVEQTNVGRGKVALVQHLGNFFALERACADDGRTVEICARR